MVLGVEQPVFLGADAKQSPSRQREAIEGERLPDFAFDGRLRLVDRRVFDRKREGFVRVNPLKRPPVGFGERRAQNFVALDKCVERPLQRGDLQAAVELENRLEPVGVVAGMQPFEKPHALLR